ncbi:MAG: class I SAM-dependent methyltransferase [Clostridia bacterium]|nr:class I SAM-dependent methyltransferase [Clostridia bacterium]
MHEDVREYYNDHVKDEDHRLDEHPFEIPVLLHYAGKYLNPGDNIFDVACGTGRIAQQLMKKGYFVGLNDLSDENIRLVKERLGTNRNLLFTERNDALESEGWSKKRWDAIFILGPMYHIISESEKVKMLTMAYDNLKPGGYVFASFMTRAGAMVYGLKNNPKGILYPDGALSQWETGTDNRFVEGTEYFTHAYFAHPQEVAPLLEKAGLKPLALAGVEGIFGERFELYHRLEEDLKNAWMDFVIKHTEDPHLIEHSKHLLSISQKPG